MSEDQSIRLVGDTANSITVPLPDGVMLVNETRGTSGSGNVKVSGGDTFYLRADVAYGNGTTWSSGEIRGEIAKSWKILSGQDRKWKSGYWDSFYAADYIITNRIAGKMAG